VYSGAVPYFVRLPDNIAEGCTAERYVNIINGVSISGQQVIHVKGFGDYEVETAAVFCAIFQRLERPFTFFDVGSNVGHFSLLCKGLWPDARIVAFEPAPDTFYWLDRIARVNSWDIRAENLAVGAEAGEVTLYLSAKSDSSNSLNPEFRDHKGEVVVRCVSLDDYCAEVSMWPEVVKIDTETLEEAVLRGSTKLLKEHHPFVIVEVLEEPGS
jgi:FkbM family methyltransferase